MSTRLRSRIRYTEASREPLPGIVWSWKGIACYLGVSPRTAQRWHRARPLPLVGVGGTFGAAKSALDAWFHRRPLDESRPSLPRASCIADSTASTNAPAGYDV